MKMALSLSSHVQLVSKNTPEVICLAYYNQYFLTASTYQAAPRWNAVSLREAAQHKRCSGIGPKEVQGHRGQMWRAAQWKVTMRLRLDQFCPGSDIHVAKSEEVTMLDQKRLHEVGCLLIINEDLSRPQSLQMYRLYMDLNRNTQLQYDLRCWAQLDETIG